jgi:DDE superfamily endonuclease
VIATALGRRSSVRDWKVSDPVDPRGLWSPKEVARRIRAIENTATAIRGRYSDELLDHRLYLPKPWCEDTPEARARREKAHVPEEVAFQPKARIAAELVHNVAVLGQTALDWVVADEEYGKAGHFHDAMDELGQRYVLEVPVTITVWTVDPSTCVPAPGAGGRVPTIPTREGVLSVAAVAAGLPAGAWHALKVREGAVGPLVFEFAALRAWAMRDQKPGPPVWLLIRRSLEETPEVKRPFWHPLVLASVELYGGRHERIGSRQLDRDALIVLVLRGYPRCNYYPVTSYAIFKGTDAIGFPLFSRGEPLRSASSNMT